MPTTLLAVVFAIYVRLQPPTVVRVDPSGEATVVGRTKPEITVVRGQDAEPSEFRETCVRPALPGEVSGFLTRECSRNWAESLNIMTANLRRTAFAAMQKENTIGKIADDQTTSEFQLRSLEAAEGRSITYVAFGVKEIHHLHNQNETIDKVVSEFHVRLVVERRSESNPSGLLIGEYWKRAIEGEKRNWVLQQTSLGRPQ